MLFGISSLKSFIALTRLLNSLTLVNLMGLKVMVRETRTMALHAVVRVSRTTIFRLRINFSNNSYCLIIFKAHAIEC